MTARPLEILLVEDDPANACLLGELLRGEPVSLVVVARLEEARARVLGGDLDAVLLDLSLPDASGIETLRQMIEVAPETPVVVLTGLLDETISVAAMQEGAQDSLVKGAVSAELLMRSIRYAIERKRSEAHARRAIGERIARQQAEARARKLRFVAEAGRLLSSSLEREATLRTAAKLAIPLLADLCFIDYAGADGTMVRVCAGADEELCRAVEEEAGASELVSQVMVSLQPALEPAVNERMLRSIVRAPEVVRRVAPRSMMVVPLLARGRVTGALSFVHRDPSSDRRHSSEELELAEELASRVALALDNAELYRAAQEASQARDDVLSVVSHDLRNPLNLINMAVGMLRRDARPERVANYVGKIDTAAQRMIRLIQDLLDVVRLENAGLSVVVSPLDVAAVVDDAVELLKPLAAKKQISVERELEAGLPRMRADRDRVLQVFSNLVGNAIKFTPEGGRIRLRAAREQSMVRFFVSDTGPGIGAQHLQRIWDRFFQARRNDRHGAGLGLAIAKGIVEAHGGQIDVRSPPGAGATFHFTIPLELEAVAEASV